ncbi:CHAT domain-containing tetratricopeptide repeat protein [Microcystis aeruginosa]|uniref:CHAT domain-containing tetratricopeptide repeat protein n=1 Tax=Microcystis aeruginosa TaxID=1126 RepID=UPI00232BDABC|nr:CHAT domain-containing protein [Microcystis aeruginosa]MDB9435024.1 CHAT domain-containing protein [Microcystis aeruginosa CS-552/01]
MNEARIEAYLTLIQALLQCENGQEPALLEANAELVDAGLVAVMEQYAGFLEQQGDSNEGRWLLNMAQQLEQILEPPRDNQDPYISFLQTLLQTIAENPGNRQAIYPLLDNNLHLLDENLVNLLRAWGNDTKEQASPEETYGLGVLLYRLADAFSRFTKGNPLINLAIAVYGYEFCAATERQPGLERDLAGTLNNLGNAYLTQAELGKEPVANLERAIAAYTEATTIYRQPGLERDLASTLTNLGVAYVTQAELGKEPVANLERAIAAYNEATTIRRQPGLERDLATTLNNLGIAYGTQAQLGQEPVANLEQAIAAFTEATTISRQPGLERDLAQTLNNLGNAYGVQAQLGQEPVANLERAIATYTEATTIRRQLGLERDLAQTLTNLGIAYRTQAKLGKEPVANLERAIAAHTEAATIRRQLGLERDLARTLNNLGNAYSTQAELGKDPVANLARAIAAYTEATTIRRQPGLERDLAQTLHNLGNAYVTQAELGKEPVVNLERAMAALKEAATIRREMGLERDLAQTLANLGNAYCVQAQLGKEPVANLERAIAAYTEATTIFRQPGLERDLAGTLTNLGVAYLTQAQLGKEPVANLERAIANYREALSFLNPALLPADTLRTGRSLGNLGFQQGWWDIAIEGYSAAVEAVEQSRAWATSEALRQEIVRESIGVYENLIQAAVNQGDLSLALRTVERSRSKRLADLIAVGDLYADGRVPPEIQAWYQQVKDSRQIQSQLRQKPLDQPGFTQKPQLYPIGNTRASFATEQLQAAEAAEHQAWDALYRFDAITAQLQQPQPQPRLDQLTALLPSPQTALLSFYTTATHTHIFVLRRPSRDGGEGVNCHTIPNPPESANDLQNWLVVNWVIPYIEINQAETAQSRQQRRDEWHQAMATRLQELATRLQFDTLIQQHLQGITELILIPHLFLHQIPFDLLPTAQGQLLGDRFRLQFVPSTKILGLCQERSQPTPDTLGIVENTTEDLPYTPLECEWVAQTWNVPRQRRLQGRTVTPDSYLQLLKQVQALLSSHHATSRADDPLNSHLVLAGEQKVTLRDLLSPLWRFPELSEVFLSCCETGLSFATSRDEEGNLRQELLDEPLSLGTGFLLGGARAVISSHWAVTDRATALFSREYHRARRAGEERLTALHQARQALRETCQKDWRDSLTVDYQQAFQTWRQMRQTKDPNVNAAQANYQKIGELIKWLDEFASDAVPFQDYRYWGAFYCLGLP